ncbi:MAG: hypothetical protein ACO3R6_08130, partial [Lutimaribacter sp.]
MVDPFDIALNRAENIVRYRKPADKMALPIGFDHDKVKPRCNADCLENFVRDAEPGKGKLVGKIWVWVVFICPFHRTIIDIVAGNCGAVMRRGQHQPGGAHPFGFVIALKPVIAQNQAAGAAQNGKMAKLR